MAYLIVVSLVWAFSFGLTKGKLAGLDSAFISAARLGLALLVFLPFFRPRGLSLRTSCSLVAIGAVQFGLMYLAYNASYRMLAAYEVALFTVTTPIIVTLTADALDRSFRAGALLAALLAVGGALVVTAKSSDFQATLSGFGLVQLANFFFAFGQVLYRRVRAQQPALRDRDVFALLYVGAFAITLPFVIARTGFVFPALTSSQFWTLLYLGVLASGVCFFWWNLGATRVNAGVLAVFNNAKIPLGVACSLLFFGEQVDVARLAAGSVLLVAALALASRSAPNRLI
jgi:drug/metabolite transporter (DMT)-like permease